MTNTITSASPAEYFAKNLQQVGFSTPLKAVLTTLKEAMDNSLDACEEFEILPDIHVKIMKLGKGNLKNTDRISISVEDNGPGLSIEDVAKVFGEYLASSKFGRGRCSRGQQGIGISAATTWAVQTTATGAYVTTKMSNQKKALECLVVTDMKKNKGVIKEKKTTEWDKNHGTIVRFEIDGRLQINGEGGLLTYLKGTSLLNPHMQLIYELPDEEPVNLERLSSVLPKIPLAVLPHPHTMKLGDFINHARFYGKQHVIEWMQKSFSRISAPLAATILKQAKFKTTEYKSTLTSLSNDDFTSIFTALQEIELPPPSTQSVMAIGEDALALSIQRLGDVDYFSVITRKPCICDFKPVQVEVAIARLKVKSASEDEPVQVLRFANRVPLQFDKSSCAIVKAITSVNWKAYDIKQSKGSLPMGPFILAVSVISPFIKFKNASKETIDASDELVEEMRRALMQVGQRLSRHMRKEVKAHELESKILHIEKFCPILIETLCRILKVPDKRRLGAEEGLKKILGRDKKDLLDKNQSLEKPV